mmetsp:Transcript_72516/g.193785  ORF Transcript_72516/g.193785 Transcript_72516/m.193785 type:complete len:117 (+) Transcript_72516:683-1033(+)
MRTISAPSSTMILTKHIPKCLIKDFEWILPSKKLREYFVGASESTSSSFGPFINAFSAKLIIGFPLLWIPENFISLTDLFEHNLCPFPVIRILVWVVLQSKFPVSSFYFVFIAIAL